MKNIIRKLLLVVSAMLVLLPVAVFGGSQSVKDGGILIHHIPDTPPENPRGISDVVIEASYDTILSCVFVSLSNAGNSVMVEITNSTTGEYEQHYIPGNGSSILPITCNAGVWTISFTLSSGDYYEGSFVI